MTNDHHTSSPADTGLDRLDLRILARYQHDTRQPAHAIGEAVGLSATAVQRRLRRLQALGVIRAEVALLDPARVGLPVTVVVHVDIERESAAHVDAFKDAMRARDEVQQCWYTTGETDFVLIVRVPSLADYERFTREALTSVPNVARFTSHVVLDEVKGGPALPIA